MHLVYDIDFIFSFGRPVLHFFPDLADVIHTIVGCRVNLDHIHGTSSCDCTTAWAFPAGTAIHRMFAVDRLCKDLGDCCLTCSPGSTKQIGMSDAVCLDLIF